MRYLPTHNRGGNKGSDQTGSEGEGVVRAVMMEELGLLLMDRRKGLGRGDAVVGHESPLCRGVLKKASTPKRKNFRKRVKTKRGRISQ